MSSVSSFTPLRRRRLSHEVVDHILASIVSGDLLPGDRLPSIVEMARAFGVAATTVREALVRLEARGSVVIRHGAGVFVAAERQ